VEHCASVFDGECDGISIVAPAKPDDGGAFVESALLKLLAQALRRDRARCAPVEADVIGAGNDEVRFNEAVFRAEDQPTMTETLGVGDVSPERVAGVCLAGRCGAGLRLTVPDFGAAAGYDDQAVGGLAAFGDISQWMTPCS
jgi:hypothetical protein